MGDDHSAMPLEITPVEEELNRQLLSDFTGERTGFLRVGPQGYFLPSKYARQAHHLYNFQPRPDDVWVATFPRSGCHMKILWLPGIPSVFTSLVIPLNRSRTPRTIMARLVNRSEHNRARIPGTSGHVTCFDGTWSSEEVNCSKSVPVPERPDGTVPVLLAHLYTMVSVDDSGQAGTTWTQELVWLIANNLDFETAGKVPQTERFPFFEFSLFLHDETKEEFIKENESDPKKVELVEQLSKPGYQILNEMTTRRFIKTHLPFSLLPKTLLEVGCKVVYVARNPKDVAVSFYHLNRLIRTQGYKGDFSKYWDYFERNLNPWTPYWSHVNEGWKLKSHPNVLFLFYEEMNKDIKSTINQVSEFLLGSRLSEKDTDRLANYLDITNFRSNPAVNYQPLREAGILVEGEQGFIRKGKNGGWVEEFTPELNKRADKWIHENLRQTDLRFPGMCDV
ncbi:hypothetical protein J6590_059362 [Homalodisca vitripennis]|nr:hypothetical protein J6590_059362 [Homalodisca vitripennis]